jgi:MOSC domain-containing protein YiiM
MQLLSIQVGKVQTHLHQGKEWTSGYKKLPVTGRVYVGKINIEGDQQQHTKFHGGEHRAVLMYSAENYTYWQEHLKRELPYGSFAENFTVSGISEYSACLGDIYEIGDEVRLQVSQPRLPCDQIYKALGIRGIFKRVSETMRAGWYLRVLQEGYVEAGMSVHLAQRIYPEWTVARAHGLMLTHKDRPEEALELATIPELEPTWRGRLQASAQIAR